MSLVLLLATLAATVPDDKAAWNAQAALQELLNQPAAFGVEFAVEPNTIDPCYTQYAPIRSGQSKQDALKRSFKIDWRHAVSTGFIAGTADDEDWWQNYIEVRNNTGGMWPFHPTRQQTMPMLSAAIDLIRLCKSMPSVEREVHERDNN